MMISVDPFKLGLSILSIVERCPFIQRSIQSCPQSFIQSVLYLEVSLQCILKEGGRKGEGVGQERERERERILFPPLVPEW